MLEQSFASLVGQRLVVPDLAQEMVRKRKNVVPAFAQGRQGDLQDVETVEQVLAKASGGDTLRQQAMGGGDDTDIDRDALVTADRRDPVIFEDAQQLGLHGEVHVADL